MSILTKFSLCNKFKIFLNAILLKTYHLQTKHLMKYYLDYSEVLTNDPGLSIESAVFQTTFKTHTYLSQRKSKSVLCVTVWSIRANITHSLHYMPQKHCGTIALVLWHPYYSLEQRINLEIRRDHRLFWNWHNKSMTSNRLQGVFLKNANYYTSSSSNLFAMKLLHFLTDCGYQYF